MHGIRTGTFLPPEALSDGPALTAAALHAVALARAGNSRKGLALALRARQQARGLELECGEIAALNAAAIVHAMRGDPIAAVAAAIDAYGLARERGSRRGMGHAMVTLAQSAFTIGALPEAADAIESCLDQAVSELDPNLEIRARNALGIVHGDRGEFERAGQELARALSLVQDHREATSPARILANIANLHCKRARWHAADGRPDEAREDCGASSRLAGDAYQLAVAEPNVPVQIDALAIQGRASDLCGAPREALKRLATACAIGLDSRCRTPLPWILCERGRIHLALGETMLARSCYAEALEIAQELRPSSKVGEACTGLSGVARGLGDEVGARRWAERARAEARELDQAKMQTRAQLEDFFTAR
jgi:tetratricopeptide (TPR) repeat protein